MAQYDIFANPSSSASAGIPYVVVIQSDPLNALATRLTMPLAVFDAATRVPTALCPVITVKGKRLHALSTTRRPCLPKSCGVVSTTSRRRRLPWCLRWTRCCRVSS